MSRNLFSNRVVFTASIALPTAIVVAVLIWRWQLNTLDTLLVVFTAGAVVDVLGIWWEERTRAGRLRDTPEGLAKLVGLSGVITSADGTAGTVRIGFEQWQARSADGQRLDPGEWVAVQGTSGQTLLVRRFSGAGSSSRARGSTRGSDR